MSQYRSNIHYFFQDRGNFFPGLSHGKGAAGSVEQFLVPQGGVFELFVDFPVYGLDVPHSEFKFFGCFPVGADLLVIYSNELL